MSEPNAPAAAPQAPAAGEPAGQVPAAQEPAAQAPGLPEAAKAAADKANAEAQQGTPWYQSLPKESHDKLKDFASHEDALKAIEAGKRFTTAKSVDDYKLSFSDPKVDQSAGPIADFKKFCLESNIPPEQAQGILEFQTSLVAEAAEEAKRQGEAALRATWGDKFEPNLTKTLVALNAIDKDIGGTLATKLKAIGGANDPDVLKALLWVHEKIGEDNLGAGGPGGAPTGPISTEQAYAELFDKKK
jgi:hypothetical protein